MRVTVVGLGYVGLVTGACLAEWGHEVVGVDADPRRLGTLRDGRVPFHEPRLPDLVADGVTKGTLQFTDDLKGASATADLVIVAVGTHDGNGGWQTDTVRWSSARRCRPTSSANCRSSCRAGGHRRTGRRSR
jgi:UDPglucose 6-dehydrogenase